MNVVNMRNSCSTKGSACLDKDVSRQLRDVHGSLKLINEHVQNGPYLTTLKHSCISLLFYDPHRDKYPDGFSS